MIPFVYGQSAIYYNRSSSPAPMWIYGQSVLNYEYASSGTTSPVPVIIQLLSHRGV